MNKDSSKNEISVESTSIESFKSSVNYVPLENIDIEGIINYSNNEKQTLSEYTVANVSGIKTNEMDNISNDIAKLSALSGKVKKSTDVKNPLMQKMNVFLRKYSTLESNLKTIENSLINHKTIMDIGAEKLVNNLKYMKEKDDSLQEIIKCLEVLSERFEKEMPVNPSVDLIMKKHQVQSTLKSNQQFHQMLEQEINKLIIVVKENQIISDALTNALNNIVPIFRIQLSTACSLKAQREALNVKKLLIEVNNKLIVDNSEMIKKTTEDIIKDSNSDYVSADSLEKADKLLNQTIELIREAGAKNAQLFSDFKGVKMLSTSQSLSDTEQLKANDE